MRRISWQYLLLTAIISALLVSPGRAGEAPPSPTISVDAEGRVLAKPDLATLILEVETQASQAQAAAQENARRADKLLKALKKAVGSEDQVRTLSFRVVPIHAPRDKNRPLEIKGYQAVNRLQVEIKDLARLAGVIDTSWQNGATQITGPYWGHSRLEELQREAAVDALGKARRMAEALAQAGGVKIKGVEKISTGIRHYPLRAMGEATLAAAPGALPTPIEVGEEEIKASVQAVFQISP